MCVHKTLKLGSAIFALVIASTHAFAKEREVKTIYQFQGEPNDGAVPGLQNPVFDKNGNIYGSTAVGGTNNFGTIFRYNSDGSEQILYSFSGSADGGRYPAGTLLLDDKGDIYGTAYSIIFELIPKGKKYIEKTLYSGGNGQFVSGLIIDKAGNLYGTSNSGGDSGFGFVYKLDKTGVLTTLHSFDGYNGGQPEAGVILDAQGNLYGTTTIGGNRNEYCEEINYYGCGIVYKLAPNGAYSILHEFDGDNGWFPVGGLVMDKVSTLYGTTEQGGVPYSGYGTVYKITSDGQYTLLNNFMQIGDGSYPESTLILDKNDNLYGTTPYGGTCVYQGGTVFRINKSGKQKVLAGVCPAATSAYLGGGVSVGPDGQLYGFAGSGSNNQGGIYKTPQ